MIVPTPHPPEFRRRAVELARRGDRPIALVARQLQISESCLRRWVVQADVDDNGSDSRLTSAEKRELAQLRRDKRRLERENELLKRVIAYLAEENIVGGPGQPFDAVQARDAEIDTACSA
ncbi:MAG: transposase [Pseudonocardiales bacterium]|jgi:transposase|nr:transposase [Pseudonocardiales bacterium]MBV9650024.1 transposase [Pseudonocardiales bacterium]